MFKNPKYNKYVYIGEQPRPELNLPEIKMVVEESELYDGVSPQRSIRSIGMIREPVHKNCSDEIREAVSIKVSSVDEDYDSTGNTMMMDLFIKSGIALPKKYYLAKRVETENGPEWVECVEIYYYLPYEREDATCRLCTSARPISPLIEDDSVDDSMYRLDSVYRLPPADKSAPQEANTVIEVLFSTDREWQRYVTIPVKSQWKSLFDVMNDLESILTDWAANGKNGFRFCNTDKDNTVEAIFFNEMGWGIDQELVFESVKALMQCVVSVRVVNEG